MGKLPDIPDLDLPSGPRSRAPVSGAQPTTPSRRPVIADDDGFGGGIEHGIGGGPQIAAPPGPHRGKAISVDLGVPDDDGFGGSIERGADSLPASRPSMPQSFSRPPISSRAPASLDLAYRRSDLEERPDVDAPSTFESIASRAVPFVGMVAALAPLIKLAHRAGAFSILKLLPRAFDASSTVQSGVISGVFLVVAMTIGYLGLRRRARSYAMVVSAGLFLLTSLAMVTVTLVSTDEAPQPPDGARLIPYLVPAAVALLGLGIAGRGVAPFLRGGALRRALSFALGIVGGLVVFAGLALSTW